MVGAGLVWLGSSKKVDGPLKGVIVGVGAALVTVGVLSFVLGGKQTVTA